MCIFHNQRNHETDILTAFHPNCKVVESQKIKPVTMKILLEQEKASSMHSYYSIFTVGNSTVMMTMMTSYLSPTFPEAHTSIIPRWGQYSASCIPTDAPDSRVVIIKLTSLTYFKGHRAALALCWVLPEKKYNTGTVRPHLTSRICSWKLKFYMKQL